jgi:hypothetical protein
MSRPDMFGGLRVTGREAAVGRFLAGVSVRIRLGRASRPGYR